MSKVISDGGSNSATQLFDILWEGKMYSLALMAALTAGSATPDWHHCGGHCGRHGGAGGYYGGFSDGCGCWGGYSNWGYCNMPHPGGGVPFAFGMTMGGTAAPGTGSGDEELGKPKTNPKSNKQTMVPARAKLLIDVPANAKLFIDDTFVKAPAGVQTFDTPALEPGKDYYYVVRIEILHDDQPLAETRRIIVRAGQVARAGFNDSEWETLKTAQAKK